MSGSVFQSMLPLNFSELIPYLTVFVPGSWTRSLILRFRVVALSSKRSHGKESFFEVKKCS